MSVRHKNFDPRRFIAAVSLSGGLAFVPAVEAWLDESGGRSEVPPPAASRPLKRAGDVTLGVYFEDSGDAKVGQTVDIFRCGGCPHNPLGHRLNHRLARVFYRRPGRPGSPGLLGLSLDPRDAARVKEWLDRGDEIELKEKLRAVRTATETVWQDRRCRGGNQTYCIGRWRG